jgi:hypothetical protein
MMACINVASKSQLVQYHTYILYQPATLYFNDNSALKYLTWWQIERSLVG